MSAPLSGNYEPARSAPPSPGIAPKCITNSPSVESLRSMGGDVQRLEAKVDALKGVMAAAPEAQDEILAGLQSLRNRALQLNPAQLIPYVFAIKHLTSKLSHTRQNLAGLGLNELSDFSASLYRDLHTTIRGTERAEETIDEIKAIINQNPIKLSDALYANNMLEILRSGEPGGILDTIANDLAQVLIRNGPSHHHLNLAISIYESILDDKIKQKLEGEITLACQEFEMSETPRGFLFYWQEVSKFNNDLILVPDEDQIEMLEGLKTYIQLRVPEWRAKRWLNDIDRIIERQGAANKEIDLIKKEVQNFLAPYFREGADKLKAIDRERLENRLSSLKFKYLTQAKVQQIALKCYFYEAVRGMYIHHGDKLIMKSKTHSIRPHERRNVEIPPDHKYFKRVLDQLRLHFPIDFPNVDMDPNEIEDMAKEALKDFNFERAVVQDEILAMNKEDRSKSIEAERRYQEMAHKIGAHPPSSKPKTDRS